VRQGEEILQRVSGWARVERVLQAIDTVEQIGISHRTPVLITGGMLTPAQRRLSAVSIQRRTAPCAAFAQEGRRMARCAWVMAA
jgi:hypothetical protein